MADETASVDGVSDGSDESRECMPCGGRGRVISNLGGSPQDVTCPWCSGTGRRQADVDAQADWRERLETAAAEGAPGPEAAAGGAEPGAAAAVDSPPEGGAGDSAAPGA